MNVELSAYARQWLKANLALCTPEECLLFKRFYSHRDLEKPMSAVMDAMPEHALDWAMQQVSRTLNKKEPQHAAATVGA